MKLVALDLFAVWHRLGGGPLRGKRGQAFWRGGDGYSIVLDPAQGKWYDHRNGRGGGALALVEVALGCDRRAALRWLEANCGLDPWHAESSAVQRNYRQDRQDREDADFFGIAGRALVEEVLDRLDAWDLRRADYTRLLGIIRTGGTTLIEEYREWLYSHPELTRAMVRAGASYQERIQRRLAFYLLELPDAA